jgi:integron integrase
MPTLLEQFRLKILAKHFSRRTGKAYEAWIRRYISFHGGRHPRDMGAPEVTAFLSYLASERKVAASTQNQALSALLFLYREVLDVELPWLDNIVRAKQPVRIPVVLTVPEVEQLLGRMNGPSWLVASILYGAGLRLMEALQLRIKDVDFEARELVVRRGKGQKDRRTMLPSRIIAPLKAHLGFTRRRHDVDLKNGAGFVAIPDALSRKYPAAGQERTWQWVFPATRIYRDPKSGEQRRHHLHETVIQRAVRAAAREAGLAKHATCHTLRHSFATHLLAAGYDIRTIQELLGHSNVSTTMKYAHVLNKGGRGVRSPLDDL